MRSSSNLGSCWSSHQPSPSVITVDTYLLGLDATPAVIQPLTIMNADYAAADLNAARWICLLVQLVLPAGPSVIDSAIDRSATAVTVENPAIGGRPRAPRR